MTTCRRSEDETRTDEIASALDDLDEVALLDLTVGGQRARPADDGDALDAPISPRGYRLLAGIPRVPPTVLDRLIQHFGNLQGLLAATAADLQAVEGVGEARARVVREGLSRLAESSIVDRYGAPL